MNLRDKIRELANSRGLSLPTLEAALGFGNGTIVRWDKASPTTEKLQKVADYFDVSIDYLLGREKSSELTELNDTYFRLAKGAKELKLTDDDVDAILNLYKRHQERNN